MRLLVLPLIAAELGDRNDALVHEISRRVPTGAGRSGGLTLADEELDGVLREGPAALMGRGVGTAADLEHAESGGRLDGADPARVSERARTRGSDQLGALGSGNHFLEVQRVAYDLEPDRVTVLIHSGSRGLGHQVCTDVVKRMDAALGRHGITLPDRQLSCAPASSAEGRQYLAAMAAAANFAWANRHVLAQRVREAIRQVLGEDAAVGTRSTTSRTT